MSHIVVGTAGHIDHGKSALVHALTGIDPDRLKEEQRRGITIELGFADLDLGEGRELSFVDVPGHERFVRQMVAGAAGIDAVLLVVAADQGVQPQTREHLDICRLLDVRRGVIALAKCDLMERELLEVAALEVRELVAGTFLDGAPLVEVSARSGAGLAALRQALADLIPAASSRPATGTPRLPVDRSFVLRGFGTVVTGTLVSGTLIEGEEVEVLPSGARGRIRGLQVHRHKVGQAAAGRRVAVNLQGIDCDAVPRGSTLTRPGSLAATRRIWARLTLLASAPTSLRRGGPVRLHQGTDCQAARLRVLGQEPNGVLRAELRLASPMVMAPGDRFIVRRPAPVDTLGGGLVVDISPPPAREATAQAFSEEALGPARAVQLRLARVGLAGASPAGLARDLATSPAELASATASARGGGAIVQAAGRWFEGDLWRQTERASVEALEQFHRREPLRAGLSREALRSRVAAKMPQEAWRELLEGLARGGALRLAGDQVSCPGHQIVLNEADRDLAGRLERAFLEAGLEPPSLDELVAEADRDRVEPIVALLIAQRRLVRIQDRRLFHAEPLARLRARLREYARSSATIDVAGFKELAGVTRKNAIPLLEQLDAERVTRRVGNHREILVEPDA